MITAPVKESCKNKNLFLELAVNWRDQQVLTNWNLRH